MSKLFIIQSTNLCNLNCKYCYLPGRKDPSLMGDQTLEQTIKLIFNSSLLVGNPVLCWHAGEPLTAKISFYKKALQYIQKHNKNNIKYTNNIQTNGVLIDDEWCEFFKTHNFSIGLSVDGPDFIHNKFRLNWANKGTHHLVQKGINKLKEHKIPINGICVLTKESLDYPEQIFLYFQNNGFQSVGFNIDEQERDNEISSFGNLNSSTKEIEAKFKVFMNRIYELWIKSDQKMNIREFNGYLEKIIGKYRYPNFTTLNNEATGLAILTIQKNGNISTFSPELASGVPDDPDKFVIGNVHKIHDLIELIENKNFKLLNNEVNNGVKNCAKSCDYFDLCGGGAPSNKYFENKTFNSTETISCRLHVKNIYDILISNLESQNIPKNLASIAL